MKLSRLSNRQLRRLLAQGEVRFGGVKSILSGISKPNDREFFKKLFDEIHKESDRYAINEKKKIFALYKKGLAISDPKLRNEVCTPINRAFELIKQVGPILADALNPLYDLKK